MDYDFIYINLPYGLQKTDENEWVAFNRKYLPLGSFSSVHNIEEWVGITYNGLTDAFINKIAVSIKQDADGNINKFYLYLDGSRPQLSVKHANYYFDRLKLLGKLKVRMGK